MSPSPSHPMNIQIKRIYDEPALEDGFRVLVDRLWPRAMSKVRAALDRWDKDVAPSTELRKRFHAAPEAWTEFRREYVRELRANPDAVEALLAAVESSGKGTLTLLYASRDESRNHALVLRDHLDDTAGR